MHDFPKWWSTISGFSSKTCVFANLNGRGVEKQLELEISVFKVGIITGVAVFWTRFVMVKLLSFQLFTKNHIL